MLENTRSIFFFIATACCLLSCPMLLLHSAAPSRGHRCESRVRGSPDEAAVFGPGSLPHPAPLPLLAAPGRLPEGGDTNAAGDGSLTHSFINSFTHGPVIST